MTDFLLLLLAGGGGGYYVWSGYVRRGKSCRACAGWGYTEHRGIFGTSARQCRKCGGSGRVLRLAARRVQRKRALRSVRVRQAAGAR
jgi:DnaJ-class molecular chaperone